MRGTRFLSFYSSFLKQAPKYNAPQSFAELAQSLRMADTQPVSQHHRFVEKEFELHSLLDDNQVTKSVHLPGPFQQIVRENPSQESEEELVAAAQMSQRKIKSDAESIVIPAQKERHHNTSDEPVGAKQGRLLGRVKEVLEEMLDGEVGEWGSSVTINRLGIGKDKRIRVYWTTTDPNAPEEQIASLDSALRHSGRTFRVVLQRRIGKRFLPTIRFVRDREADMERVMSVVERQLEEDTRMILQRRGLSQANDIELKVS